MTAVVELIDVVKRYPGPVEALGGVSLCVQEGELMSIVGPSGSGKSTLLHIIGTLERASAGVVRIAGVDIAGADDRALSAIRARRIGFVFQQFHLLEAQSSLANVADGLLYSGTSARVRRERAHAALDRVGLGHRVTHNPARMSGGERQRVAIARALVSDPTLVLADEPTGNLDTASGERLMDLLRELNDAGATIIVITHDAEVAAATHRQVDVRDGLVMHDSGALSATT